MTKKIAVVGRWPLAVGRWPLAVGRWPLAVGRWPLAVGRWPLAVGLSVGAMCALNVPVAHAGHWEFVPLPTDYSARQADASERYPGNIETTCASTWNGHGYGEELTMYPYSYPLADMMFGNEDGSSGSFGAGIGSTGGEGSVIYNGTIQAKLRYIQATITDANNNTVPDPNDVPRTPFSIKVTASSNLSAMDGVGNGDVRMPSKESVSASITSAGNGTVQSDASDVRYGEPYAKYLDSSRTIYVLVDPQGELTKTIPIVKFDTKALLENQRKTQSGDSGDEDSHWNEGSVQNWSQFSSEITNYGLTISSDIEPSWKKLGGDLPQEYKKFSGQWGWQPDPDKAQQVSADPLIWRVKCHPGADGSMMVESAAEWLDDTNHGGPVNPDFYEEPAKWYAGRGAYFSPRTAGFLNGQYQWSYSGGVPLGDAFTARSEIDDEYGFDLRSSMEYDSILSTEGQHPEGLSLGTARHQLAVNSTNVTLTGTETNGAPVTLTNEYVINWHLPYEKQKDLSSTRGISLMGKSVNVPYTGTINIPAEEPQSINIAAGLEGIAGAVGATTGPVGYAVATSIAYGLAGLVDLNWEYGGQPGYSFENGANTWDKAQASPEWLNENFSPPASSAWTSEEEGFTNFDVTMQLTKRWTNMRWEADEYGSNGFVGPQRVLFAGKDYVMDYEPHYTLRPNKPVAPPTGGV